MLLNLPRRRWQWTRLTDTTGSTLCLRCQRRGQHSAAVEAFREVREENAESREERRPHQVPRGTHPPRPPRRYIEGPRRDAPIREFKFMQQEPRPRPPVPRQQEPLPEGRTSSSSYNSRFQPRNQAMEKDIDLVASVIYSLLELTYT
jgi:hypothetical protein